MPSSCPLLSPAATTFLRIQNRTHMAQFAPPKWTCRFRFVRGNTAVSSWLLRRRMSGTWRRLSWQAEATRQVHIHMLSEPTRSHQSAHHTGDVKLAAARQPTLQSAGGQRRTGRSNQRRDVETWTLMGLWQGLITKRVLCTGRNSYRPLSFE